MYEPEASLTISQVRCQLARLLVGDGGAVTGRQHVAAGCSVRQSATDVGTQPRHAATVQRPRLVRRALGIQSAGDQGVVDGSGNGFASFLARVGGWWQLTPSFEALLEYRPASLLAVQRIAATGQARCNRPVRQRCAFALAAKRRIAVQVGAAMVRRAAKRGALLFGTARQNARVTNRACKPRAAILAGRRTAVVRDAVLRDFARARSTGLRIATFLHTGVEQAMRQAYTPTLARAQVGFAVRGDAARFRLLRDRCATVGRDPRLEAALLELGCFVRTALFAAGRLAIRCHALTESYLGVGSADGGVTACGDAVMKKLVRRAQAALDAHSGLAVIRVVGCEGR